MKAYLANQRQGTHATKTRSLVSGGGKKPFKQKGTGNARQGSSRSPLMEGGATAHGPQPRDYSQQINKKVRKLAVKVALSDKVRAKSLVVLDEISLDKYSSKAVVEMLKNIGCADNKVLISDKSSSEHLYKSTRNIHRAFFAEANSINIHSILNSDKLVLTKSAVLEIGKRMSAGGAK